MDYKDWIQNRAEELAQELYDTEFYELPTSTRNEVYERAMADYTDYIADKADAAYKRHRDKQLGIG